MPSKWRAPTAPVPLSTYITARTKPSNVLEGDYSVFIGDEVIPGVPGTWVWGPRDVPHGYQVHSPQGRHLSLTTPAGFEAFFEEVANLATPSTDPRTVMGQLTAVAARYGVELLGPPRSQA